MSNLCWWQAAVDRMGGCHIRRAVEDLDAAEPRMCQRDWIARFGEAIDLSDALVMAKEVVEGAVLLVEHDDVLDRGCAIEQTPSCSINRSVADGPRFWTEPTAGKVLRGCVSHRSPEGPRRAFRCASGLKTR